ncbi:MAG TPA: hypothetical protein PK358_15695 [Spirochaetota bacterium]|nr:hypothetical protein [Spirochaetota bacterium]HPJ36282.1 hypothetical protein [Spirochaetota bacterium]
MKKSMIFIAAIILFFLSIILLPSENEADNIWTITPESLIDGYWDSDIDTRGLEIEFKQNGKFESELVWPGEQAIAYPSGTYTIKNGRLTLSIENGLMCEGITGVKLEGGTPGYDPVSPKYRRYISFKGKQLEKLYFETKELKIWDCNSGIEEGENLKINGLEAVAMGIKEGSTTTVLKMRNAPSEKAEQVHYSYTDEDDQKYTVKALPLNTSLTVLARTKKKDKVGKWNNYWYYVEFETYFDYMRAWVYGEFVKIKE